VRTPGKLGRLAPINKPALKLGTYLTGVIPAHPVSVDYLSAMNGGWQLLGNDQYGDCVAVAWANNRRLISTTLGTGEYPSQQDVFAVYETQNPGFPAQDNGMVIQLLLEWLARNEAPDGSQLLGFAKVDHTSPDEVKAALAIFGSLMLGITVTDANETAFGEQEPWDYNPAAHVLGGHGVVAGGYGPGVGVLAGDERFITWAEETSFTDTFWDHQVEEAWVLIYPEHLGTKEFLEGVDVAQLAQDYTEITGQAFPGTTPPVPPPASAPKKNLIQDLIVKLEELVDWLKSL
jgi:hypothetical protein